MYDIVTFIKAKAFKSSSAFTTNPCFKSFRMAVDKLENGNVVRELAKGGPVEETCLGISNW